VNSITVTPQLQHVIDRAYPGLSPRQQASKIRGLIHEILLDMILASGEPGTPGRDEFRTSVLPCAGDGHETATRAANRVAKMAPSIDDQNWVKLETYIQQAKDAYLWDNPAELRLIARLNDPFDGAENQFRVQNSRITAFFRRML
jgi:hypothetical protein